MDQSHIQACQVENFVKESSSAQQIFSCLIFKDMISDSQSTLILVFMLMNGKIDALNSCMNPKLKFFNQQNIVSYCICLQQILHFQIPYDLQFTVLDILMSEIVVEFLAVLARYLGKIASHGKYLAEICSSCTQMSIDRQKTL